MIIIIHGRRPTIKQSQLDDFLGFPTLSIYDMRVQKTRNATRKKFKRWLPVEHRKKSKGTTNQNTRGRQTELLEFLPKRLLPELSSPAYTCRFRSIPEIEYEDFAADVISSKEWFILHALPDFKGYFNNLFECVDFSFFDDLQDLLEHDGIFFKGIFIHDVVAFELLRLQLGFKDYTGLEKMGQFILNNPLEGVLHDKLFFPSASDISYVMRRIPAKKLLEFMYMLVKELIELKVIVPRILVWDCQFVRSNCSNNKNPKTNVYNDIDAGYGRHNGKKLGVGYSVSRLYAFCGSWDRAFEIHFEVFPANKNENPIFRETLVHFLKLGIGKWQIILGDTGGYSEQSMELGKWFGIHPLIRARKKLVNQPTVEVKKGYWFNTSYFPAGWTADDVMSMYTRRPVIEACQSWNDTIYNAARMNTRGKENVIRQQAMINILALTRAITAHKLGRNDLIPVITAFSAAREHVTSSAWPILARKSGYDVLMPSKPSG